MEDRSIIIIGAGFAGLSAGIYAQMNGYQTSIFEMSEQPGGLCTSWKRRGYTIDGCVHWLVGSSPKSPLYRCWQEVGVVQGREFINLDEFTRYEGADGRTLSLYTDVDRLEKHLLEFSPQDAEVTLDFIQGIRLCLRMNPPAQKRTAWSRLLTPLMMVWFYATRGKEIQKWMMTTTREFCDRFKDPVLRGALLEMWFPEFSMFFMLFTFAYLHLRLAGYPIGGSLPLSQALEKRYLDLGGKIYYKSRVEKILVESNRAVGVRLIDGREHHSGRVISAADGHATIFDMLEGKYADNKVREPYEKWTPFPSLLYIGLGVNRTFENEPRLISGLSIALSQPVELGDRVIDHLPLKMYNFDPTLAPEGKTSVVVMLPSRYEYWKELAQDHAAYEEKKDQIARTVVELLNQRFPGISGQVEVMDMATPLTFERYTGNWRGSFEGWMITPHNAPTMQQPMSQTLPGLQNFSMCGQWVEPGGGLPTGVMSGRRLVQALCKEDGFNFQARIKT